METKDINLKLYESVSFQKIFRHFKIPCVHQHKQLLIYEHEHLQLIVYRDKDQNLEMSLDVSNDLKPMDKLLLLNILDPFANYFTAGDIDQTLEEINTIDGHDYILQAADKREVSNLYFNVRTGFSPDKNNLVDNFLHDLKDSKTNKPLIGKNGNYYSMKLYKAMKRSLDNLKLRNMVFFNQETTQYLNADNRTFHIYQPDGEDKFNNLVVLVNPYTLYDYFIINNNDIEDTCFVLLYGEYNFSHYDVIQQLRERNPGAIPTFYVRKHIKSELLVALNYLINLINLSKDIPYEISYYQTQKELQLAFTSMPSPANAINIYSKLNRSFKDDIYGTMPIGSKPPYRSKLYEGLKFDMVTSLNVDKTPIISCLNTCDHITRLINVLKDDIEAPFMSYIINVQYYNVDQEETDDDFYDGHSEF